MIVPEHWAEARLQVRQKGRQVTVRRFGWSDQSTQAARAHAEERAKAALDAILSGEKLPRRELRSNYGILGVPIREQIVARHGDVIVTRNSYGALCLNTPDVLFADMDFEQMPSGWVLPLFASAGAWIAGMAVAKLALGQRMFMAIVAGIVAMFILNLAVKSWKRMAFGRDGGPDGRALARVQAFSQRNPGWHMRAYRTPAGLRLLAMHRVFSPEDAEVDRLFRAMNGDRLYSTMCKVQQCFRARLTAKPWRIGMERHIKPRVAAWSSDQAARPDRLAWIAEYERKAAGFAACRYMQSFGDTDRVDPRAEQVRALHDDAARALVDLPLA